MTWVHLFDRSLLVQQGISELSIIVRFHFGAYCTIILYVEFWRESFYYFICLSFVFLFVFFYLFWFLFFLLLINVTVYIHWSTKKNRIRNVIHVASLKLVLFQYHMSQLNCYYYKRINYSVLTICMDYNELLIKHNIHA